MDAATLAVALMGQQKSLQQLDFANRMVKAENEATQEVVDLIATAADAGTLYSAEGKVSAPATGTLLDTIA